MLHNDLLIVNCDGNDVGVVVALDAQTGKVRWKANRHDPVSQAYTTPLVIRVGERDQVVSVGAHHTIAYDPRTGKEIWRVGYGDGFSNVPRPVYGHGMVYITTGFFQPELMAVRVDGAGDVTRSHVAWTLKRSVPLTPSPLLVGDEIYVISDNGIATCLDAKDGTILWQERLGGNYSASPVYADGRIYFLNEEGVATVVAPGRTLRRLAVNRWTDRTLASIGVARGSLFIRTQSNLYRIAESLNPGAHSSCQLPTSNYQHPKSASLGDDALGVGNWELGVSTQVISGVRTGTSPRAESRARGSSCR